jgi:hypothetical protein
MVDPVSAQSWIADRVSQVFYEVVACWKKLWE